MKTSCNREYMEVIFVRASYPHLQVSKLHWNDGICRASGNSSHIILRAPYFYCGTTFKLGRSELEKSLINVVRGTEPSITVSCPLLEVSIDDVDVIDSHQDQSKHFIQVIDSLLSIKDDCLEYKCTAFVFESGA